MPPKAKHNNIEEELVSIPVIIPELIKIPDPIRLAKSLPVAVFKLIDGS